GLVLGYAGLLRCRLDLPGLADDHVEHLIALKPDAPEARLKAARYFRAFGRLEQAEKHARYALEQLHREDAELLLVAADVAQARDNSADARKYLERGRQLHPRDTRLAQALAHLDLQKGDRDRALGN